MGTEIFARGCKNGPKKVGELFRNPKKNVKEFKKMDFLRKNARWCDEGLQGPAKKFQQLFHFFIDVNMTPTADVFSFGWVPPQNRALLQPINQCKGTPPCPKTSVFDQILSVYDFYTIDDFKQGLDASVMTRAYLWAHDEFRHI